MFRLVENRIIFAIFKIIGRFQDIRAIGIRDFDIELY